MTEQLSFTAALDRDALGRVAHQVFRDWQLARRPGDDYYNVNWEDLSERAREAYRVVAEAVAKTVQGTQL